MTRFLHRWAGLLLAILLSLTALSGTALSVFPAIETLRAPAAEDGLSVATLASRVLARHPGLEQLRRAPSGRITAWWFDGNQPGSAVIDPATGLDVAPADPDPLQRWLTRLHRDFLLGEPGRWLAAAGALAMLVLTISGAWLVVRRTGGWRRWFTRLRGPQAGRLHTKIARLAVPGLLLSALTALWMSAQTFELVSVDAGDPDLPAAVSGLPAIAAADLDALKAVAVADLRELGFPAVDDPEDVYTLRTTRGVGYVDPGTGALTVWQDASLGQQVSDTLASWHTGRGAAVLGLLLGLCALGVPVLTLTGVQVWLAGWRARPRLRDNAPAAQADTVVLVGSEGGSTWGFAATLATALRRTGQSVQVAPMSGFAPERFPRAQRYLMLAATYGEGAAPASAAGFLDRLRALPTPAAPLAVLGFGDRSFPAYCAFAAAVAAAARERGWPELLSFDTIDRQSPQDFARWGRRLGAALGLELELDHQPTPPPTETLTLLSRRDYGAAVGAPMAILRFALPATSGWQRLRGHGFTRFEAGDLLGVVPNGSPIPRFYSLASGARDGFIEIVVRRHPGGLASTQLTDLEPGQTLRGFLRPQPGFHADRTQAPLILIGAGTGVGPLAGFIRNNRSKRPIQLYFGLRDPDSDFLYDRELAQWQREGKLAGLALAASRGATPRHVQNSLRQAAPDVLDAVRQGARVMVCGGREMAGGVADTLADILKPEGLSPAQLKAADRYVEDVY